MRVRVQHMFPNCEKYKKCCTDDAEFWAKLEGRTITTPHKKTPFRIENIKLKFTKSPEGFEGW